MPTLADTLRKNSQKSLVRGPGGVLSEESTEEIQNLAGQAGLPAPPTTAIGAAAIGATPKQQDMMGTPAQKTAALNLSAQAPGATVQDALRRREVRSEATAQEAASQQKSETLKNLGGLGDRVNDFINAQRAKMEQSQVSLQAADQAQTVQGQKADMSSLKPLLQQLSADPNNMQLQLQVNQALGYDANRQLSPEEINSLYKNATDSIVQAGGQAVDDNLNVDDLVQMEQFGYTKDQLAGLLNVPVEQLGSMSLGQIRGQVNQLLADEFSTTAQMEQQAGSLNAGQAERALARQGAREASRVGIRSTEQDVANLEQQIASAEQVQFGGQTYKVDDLLRDDTISNIISSYLNAAPGSPTRTQLEQSEPQLIQFISKNQALLQDAAEQLSGGAQQFQQLQADRRDAATMGGLLSPELAADLVPGFNELGAEALDPSTVPVLAATQGMGENQKRQYAQNIQSIANEFPVIAKELGTLSQEEVAALGLDNPAGKWTDYVAHQRRYNDIMQTPDEDILGLVSKVFDVGGNADFTNDVRVNAANNALGFKSARSGAISAIDADGDGRIDSPSDIRSRLVTGQPTLRDSLSGKSSVAGPQKYDAPIDPPSYDKKHAEDYIRFGKGSQKEEQLQASLWKRLKNVAYNGNLQASELADAYAKSSDATDADVQAAEIQFLLKNAPLDSEAKGTLQSILEQRVADVTARVAGKADKLINLDKIESIIEDRDPRTAQSKGPKQMELLSEAIGNLRDLMDSYANYDRGPLEEKLRRMEKAQKNLSDRMGNFGHEKQAEYDKAAEKKKADQKKKEQEMFGSNQKQRKK